MKNIKPMLLLFTGFFLSHSHANALEITGLGGMTYGNISQRYLNQDVVWTSQVGYSFGILASTNFLVLPFEIESGFMYSVYGAQKTVTQETWKTKWAQIPVIARFTFADIIGVGAGAYVGFAQGTIDSSLPNATLSTQYTYESLGLNKTDAGLVLDARLKIPVAPMLGLVLDARYNLGLLNLANSNTTYTSDSFYNRYLLVMAGVSLGL